MCIHFWKLNYKNYYYNWRNCLDQWASLSLTTILFAFGCFLQIINSCPNCTVKRKENRSGRKNSKKEIRIRNLNLNNRKYLILCRSNNLRHWVYIIFFFIISIKILSSIFKSFSGLTATASATATTSATNKTWIFKSSFRNALENTRESLALLSDCCHRASGCFPSVSKTPYENTIQRSLFREWQWHRQG